MPINDLFFHPVIICILCMVIPYGLAIFLLKRGLEKLGVCLIFVGTIMFGLSLYNRGWQSYFESQKVQIMTIESDKVFSQKHYYFFVPSNVLELIPHEKHILGESFIYNKTNMKLCLYPVSYTTSLARRIATYYYGNGKEAEIQVINPNTFQKVSQTPDYVFDVPDSIIVKARRLEEKTVKKWAIKDCDEILTHDITTY